jgi:hypothetical protein
VSEKRNEVTHRCPVGDSPITPCCGRSPFELRATDRLTVYAGLVTCLGAANPPAKDSL